MEVLQYLKSKIVRVRWFDLESKEVRTRELQENKLLKAS
jgi:hypothetical protein